MDPKERYESLQKETRALRKKMLLHLALILGILLAMVAVLIILYFAFPQLARKDAAEMLSASVRALPLPSAAEVHL